MVAENEINTKVRADGEKVVCTKHKVSLKSDHKTKNLSNECMRKLFKKIILVKQSDGEGKGDVDKVELNNTSSNEKKKEDINCVKVNERRSCALHSSHHKTRKDKRRKDNSV